jgi:hypothetical protein
MKLIIIAFFGLSSLTALSAPSVTRFTCITDDVIEGKKPTKFEFSVTGLGTKEVNYYTGKDEENPFKMHPKNSVLMLNDNFGILENSKGLVLDSDGDGCQFTQVVIYSDSNYTRGYAKVDGSGGCGAGNYYSKLTCSLQ